MKELCGVPITYLGSHNPNQYEIIGLLASAGYVKEQVGIPKLWDDREARGVVNGKVVYSRILIKKKGNRLSRYKSRAKVKAA